MAVHPAFVDVARGQVPPYQEFVRHVWQYRAPDTGAPVIDRPPWVYSCLVENAAEWALVQRAVRRPLAVSRVRVEPIEVGGGIAHQVLFADLATLHRFITQLSCHHAAYGTAAAYEASEFIMWTLGFRWV